MAGQTILLLLSIFIFSMATMSTAVDTIRPTQIIKDGETIVSSGGNFELGFFSPGNSKNRYVGIWYKKISKFTVVWVANRDVPVNDSSGMLELVDQGKLVLLNSANATVWSSNSSRPGINPVARLLDNGNFVVRDENDSDEQIFLWQSFDYPGDTFLPNVKFGIDLETGINRYITSWKSPDDPSRGEFTNKVDQNGVPQLLLSEGSHVRFRSGHWNGLRFSGMVNLKPNRIYTFEFVFNDKEIYYEYQLTNSSVLSRMALSPEGALQRFIWVESSQSWNLYLTANPDNCDRFALCGANGVCDINNSPACGCLEGFRPRSPDEWTAADWSQGCVREVELGCSVGEGFLKYPGIKLPDTRQSRYNKTMSLQECEKECLRNCNCTAYANLDIRNGGSGCILWFGELVDIRQYNEYGQDIYLRMSASEIDKYQRFKGRRRVRIIVISVVLVGVFLIAVCLFLLVLRKKKKNRREGESVEDPGQDCTNQSNTEDIDIPLFDLATLVEATNCFSISNKLGQGGYGPVYKGILQDGQVIAVKRLSTRSRQGIEEFKNEAGCIAKLQHRNLVKLLGCCIELDERILIYEYMPNKSLDSILFDKRQSMLLNWSKRFHVINGIARGLLYLHQDSRLRIIHRDLKASNVLLDNDMNPKISDFGMARSFGEDETSANTNRIVGTYGYMSPEYAIDGLFSVKSDVFSFGVLVLETVSGRKNRGFRHSDHKLNLLGHAWMLHKEGRSWELIDASVKEESKLSEALRSIHVGLLCVQRSPEDRPNMSRVVLMLSSDITLVQPKEPGFFSERELLDSYSSSTIVQESDHESSSTNELTMTLLEAR